MFLQVTCMDCLEVMKDAVYCQRCSHTGCRRCLDVDDSGMCKDCMCVTLSHHENNHEKLSVLCCG